MAITSKHQPNKSNNTQKEPNSQIQQIHKQQTQTVNQRQNPKHKQYKPNNKLKQISQILKPSK